MKKVTFEQLPDAMQILLEKINRIEGLLSEMNHEPATTLDNDPNDPLAEYIPKSEVRDRLASSSTLWKYEKNGKLTLYAIGGKRFYKRSDIANLFTEVKQKKA